MTTLAQAHVKNFQSVADVTVDFGKFTVMVGQSNSGKSAFLRGVRSCIRNSFVPSNVRQGTTKSEVDLLFDDGTQVSIERGKSLSTYKMNNGADVFTKSARGVPEEVEAALKIPLVATVDPFFSFQFDKPFLLSDTGSIAAQVIGSLTNVSLLHNSVREANRRRQEVLGVVKVKEQDVRQLQIDFESYRDLPQRKKELDNIQESLRDVESVQQKLDGLTSALDVVRYAQESIDSLDETSPKNYSEEIQRLRDLNDSYSAIQEQLSMLSLLSNVLKNNVQHAKQVKYDLDLTTKEYHDILVELKQCPTCGQTISKEDDGIA
jgi:DNA repair ATPase RecN